MTFAYFLVLYLIPSLILDMEESVSAILLQLILLPFSLPAILVSPNVYTPTIQPMLPLSIAYPLFPYLYWVSLPSCDICLVL
jgi:hypothetical protein